MALGLKNAGSFVLVSCLAYYSTADMEVASSAKTSVDFYFHETSLEFHETTMCYIREDRTFQSLLGESETLLHFILHPV